MAADPLSGDLVLVTHMLMSGSWHIYRAGERWQRPRREMRVVIAVAGFEAVAFNVPVAKFYTARTLERNSAIPKLGPDLLGTQFATDEARTRLMAHGDEEIANVLLNQRVMAGLGNVYKSEVLFACGVHPFRLVSTLRCGVRLHSRTCEDISRSECEGHEGRRNGDLHRPAPYDACGRSGCASGVYRREGKECRRCGATILMQRQGPGARSTYWCPECQPRSG